MDIQNLFYVSNNEEVNNFFPGIYTNTSINLSEYSSLIVRKAFCSNGIYANQIYLGTASGNTLVYSRGYATSDEALSSLEDFIIAEYGGKTLFYALVDWSAVEIGQTGFDISECQWNCTNDISRNLNIIANMFKRQDFKFTGTSSEGWPLRINNRIQNTTSGTLINDEENKIFGILSGLDQFTRGKENIVIEDKPLGRFCVFETTNTQYSDYNIVRKRAYNPNYTEKVYRNVLPFLVYERNIYTSDFITSPKDVIVYMNGVRLSASNYTVYRNHNLIQLCDTFDVPDGAEFTIDYISKQERFIINPTFEGLNFVENEPAGKRKQFDLNGIDTGSYTNNNYNVTRHGFRPMSFILEGYPITANDEHNHGMVHDEVNYKGFMIGLVNDPAANNLIVANKVLRYKHGMLDMNNSDNPIRIENVVSRHIKANKIIADVDFYIPSSIKGSKFKERTIEWFTIQEYWEGRTPQLVWGDGENSTVERRITLSLVKNTNEEQLHFKCDVSDVTVSALGTENNNDNDIPESIVYVEFDQWISLHVEIIAGGDRTGHIEIFATIGGMRHVIYNKFIRTICEAQVEDVNTLRPVFEDFSVMKLYTSKFYIDKEALRSCAVPSDETGACRESCVEMFFKNCYVECICAVDDPETDL